jgi:AcrR family transcriptional regulator
MKTVSTISKKQFIINTAADLFKEKGYSGTSIRDLASKVGLEPSSIYSHIKSKEELLSEICMDCAGQFTEGIEKIFHLKISARKKLKALISLHLDMAFTYPASVTVFNDEWRHLPEPILVDFIHLRKEYEKKFRKILNEGKDDGKFNFENSEIVFNIIIKSLSWSYEAVKKYKREDLESELSDFILNALNK